MSPFVGSNILAGASGSQGADFKVERSLRFNNDDSAYLNRTPSSAGNLRTWTWSGWVKKNASGTRQMIFGNLDSGAASGFDCEFQSDDTLDIYDYNSGYEARRKTTQVFRDPSAWYHLVVTYDSTNTTAADRLRLYVNGDRVTTFSTSTDPTLDADGRFNTAVETSIGRSGAYNLLYLDAYLAEVHFIDGQALDASDFGEYDSNNVWQPKKFAGSYNTDGYTVSGGPYYTSSTTWAHALNGSTTGRVMTYTTTSTTATFSPGISWSSQFRIYGLVYGGGYCKVNGGSNLTGFSTGAGWVDVTSQVGSSGTLNSVTVGDVSSNYFALYAIELDGTILNVPAAGVNGFHLDFSDNSSDAALGTDSSGNNNTFTVNNLTAVDAFGIESACSIDTTTKTISFPVTYTATITYEFFVQVTTAATYTYFAHDDTGPSLWNLAINASGDLLFGNYNGGWTTFSSTGLDDGNWHFVRLTTTGSSTSLYIDGSLFSTNASGGSATTGTRTNTLKGGAFKIAHLRITTGGTPPTTGIPAISSMNQAAGSGGTLAFYDALDDIASSGTKTSDGGNVTITMSAETSVVTQENTDSLIDTPTNYTASSGNNAGNYCTWNPLAKDANSTLSNGNLQSQATAVGGNTFGTIKMPNSGKYYWECKITAGTTAVAGFGLTVPFYTGNYIVSVVGIWYVASTGNISYNSTQVSYGATFGVNDVIGIAVDCDDNTIEFFKNGVSQGEADPSAYNLNVTDYVPGAGDSSGNYNNTIVGNFGQSPFAYTPPSGYVSLCSTNLPESTIADGSTAMDVVTYTGNGTSQTISGLGFSPDLVWSKIRSSTGKHRLTDSVRGTANALRTDGTNAEFADTNVTAFNSDGFDIGANGNGNSSTYVAWTWDGGNLATSSAYEQSQVWSSALTSSTGFRSSEPATNAFDSSTSTICSAVGSGLITFAPTGTFPSNSAIRIYLQGSGSQTVTVNGGAGQTISGNSWQTVNFTNSSASSFTLTVQASGGTDSGLRALEIGGKILVDAGIIPVGSLNSSVYDQSQTWSNYFSGDNLTDATNAFDGSTSTIAQSPNAASAYLMLTYTFYNVTSLRVYASNPTNNQMRLNNTGSYTAESALGATSNAGWRDLTSLIPSNGTVTHIEAQNSGTNGVNWAAIEVNGKLLINSGVSVTNVPSIVSTARANPSAGFSIVQYKGSGAASTIGHKLNASPSMVIFKPTSSTGDWYVYTDVIDGSLDYLKLNAYDAKNDSAWTKLLTSTNVLEMQGSSAAINSSGVTYIAYCFAPVAGYSAFGSYTGNGAADGPFVYTGFRPQWLLVKSSSTTYGWLMVDAVRNTFNYVDNYLYANLNAAENNNVADLFTFTANGFKVGNSLANNASGATFIYAAFAEHPFKTARAR